MFKRLTGPSDLSDTRKGELEGVASKSVWLAVLIGLLGGPLGYIYVGSWRWAVINFVTLNYLLTGIVLVPLHTTTMITESRAKVK